MVDEIQLDTAIRNWVLIPIILVMFLIGLLRHYIGLALKEDKPPKLESIKETQSVMRARVLRMNSGLIPASSFRMRRSFFADKEKGLLVLQKKDAAPAGSQMMSDPSFAVDMMKKNLGMMLPQTLTFAWISFFFSGFVTAKIPFPLTQRFRPMLQRGVESLTSLDVTYVSSQSWYFLNLFGLRGLFNLVIGDASELDDTSKMMQMQMQMAGSGLGPDPGKALQGEADALDLLQHESTLGDIERRAGETLRYALRR